MRGDGIARPENNCSRDIIGSEGGERSVIPGRKMLGADNFGRIAFKTLLQSKKIIFVDRIIFERYAGGVNYLMVCIGFGIHNISRNIGSRSIVFIEHKCMRNSFFRKKSGKRRKKTFL